MNRRSFLRFAAALPALTLVPPIVVPEALGLELAPLVPVELDVSELSYIIRRAFVKKMLANLYNMSPLAQQLVKNAQR